LFHLKSDGASQSKSGVGHRREASKQLVTQLGKKIKAEKGVKKEHSPAFRKAMAGLKKTVEGLLSHMPGPTHTRF
jgi:hypothetical protein